MKEMTNNSRMAEGSFTVEAAFVISLTLFAVMAALLMSFYLRDVCSAAARIRLDSLESAAVESGADPAPVFTLTNGRLSGSAGAMTASLRMAGFWPLSRLHFTETVRPETPADPVRQLRQLRQEGLR